VRLFILDRGIRLTAVAESGLRRFRLYPAYKDSGVEWLGEVPGHWGVKRLKTFASIQLSVALHNYGDVFVFDTAPRAAMRRSGKARD
jgi:hypothetical protein